LRQFGEKGDNGDLAYYFLIIFTSKSKTLQVKFSQDYYLRKIFNASSTPISNRLVEVHCLPFYYIYKAIGRTEIDLFIIDVEGHEMEIMHTIPWDKVNILGI
jgi:Methyltransferase FkbM domain